MAVTSSSSSTLVASVFEVGKYPTKLINVESRRNTPNSPPKPLLIATPSEGGDGSDSSGDDFEFPVVLFLHGYMFQNSFYSQLIQHVASHGYIVVAPQLYRLATSNATGEIKSAADITDWLPQGLQMFLPPHIKPNLKKLGLAGHSRGGKVAFALALGQTASSDLKFSALIGVDPVDGRSKGNQTTPAVLTYVPDSFNFKMMTGSKAAMVIGSGLGEAKTGLVSCPCAPKGVNHENFYNECAGPACYMVAKDYGHCDMLDDDTEGSVIGKVSYCMCKNGKARKPMREFVGGAMVAFLRGYLDGDNDLSVLKSILEKKQPTPVVIQPVDSKGME